MLWSFFNSHLELLFLKFDKLLLKNILGIIISGLSESTFEIQSDCTNCTNAFCDFVHEKLKRKPTQKSAYLVQCVTSFYNEVFSVFTDFLKQIMYVILFEEPKNVWVF